MLAHLPEALSPPSVYPATFREVGCGRTGAVCHRHLAARRLASLSALCTLQYHYGHMLKNTPRQQQFGPGMQQNFSQFGPYILKAGVFQTGLSHSAPEAADVPAAAAVPRLHLACSGCRAVRSLHPYWASRASRMKGNLTPATQTPNAPKRVFVTACNRATRRFGNADLLQGQLASEAPQRARQVDCSDRAAA